MRDLTDLRSLISLIFNSRLSLLSFLYLYSSQSRASVTGMGSNTFKCMNMNNFQKLEYDYENRNFEVIEYDYLYL